MDDSDESVGHHGEEWIETDTEATCHFDGAAIEATTLAVASALDRFCLQRSEAAFEASQPD